MSHVRALLFAVVAPLCLTLLTPCAAQQRRRARPPVKAKRTTVRTMKSLPEGTWGGPGIGLRVGGGAARLEYDCAHGRINPPFTLDGRGSFKLRGTHVAERGGPSRDIVEYDANSPPEEEGQPAIYVGRVSGNNLTLTVTLADTGDKIGTYELARGREPQITKCY